MEYGDRVRDVFEGLAPETSAPGFCPRGYLRLALAGKILPSESITRGLREAALDAVHRWKDVADWAKALVFSDNWEVVREALLDLSEHRDIINDVLPCLAYTHHRGPPHLLSDLAERDPIVLQREWWGKAMAARKERDAAEIMMKLLEDETKCAALSSQGSSDPSAKAKGLPDNPFAKGLAERAKADPTIRKRLVALSKASPGPALRVMLTAITGHLCQDAEDDDLLRSMIEHQYDNSMLPIIMRRAQNCAQNVRAELLHLVHRNIRHADDVLSYIDKLHDDFGFPADELRHPDLGSGMSWPRV